jgi:hypothetical protein
VLSVSVFWYGFLRWWRCVHGVTDKVIFPAFVRLGLRINAGSDNWMGYDLLAAHVGERKQIVVLVGKE